MEYSKQSRSARRRGDFASALRGTALASLAAFALLACASGARERGREVVVDPARFVGFVEIAQDPRHGSAVVVSTATEEVRVARGPAERELRRERGERVELVGTLVERPQQIPVMDVRAFRVLGEERLHEVQRGERPLREVRL
jgi:hypothetical protein